jgi:hypothetical protein
MRLTLENVDLNVVGETVSTMLIWSRPPCHSACCSAPRKLTSNKR